MVHILDTLEALGAFVSTNEKATIDFWAPWCAPCKALAPMFDALSEEYTDVKFAKIDVQAIPDAAAMFGVRGIPAILGFHNGDEVFREAGARKEKLAAALDQLVML
jgi:thioredoxin 1